MADERMPQETAQAISEDRVMSHLASRLTNSALLALAGGFLDGFTYTGHGHVFANAMTGNVVMLGIYCFSGSVAQGLRHLPPILMFLLGVTVAQTLETPYMRRLLRHTHLVAILIQIVALVGLALLPASTPDMWFTTLIAFSASVQVESFRKVNGRSFNSTFTTGNLRTMTESLFAWLVGDGGEEARGASWDFAVICVAFFAGAACGGVATMRLGNSALWFDIALLAIVVVRVSPRRTVAGI